MKININKNLVEFTPENAPETAKLEEVWRLIIDCAGISKKLVPVGEFTPGKDKNVASFLIEGLTTNVPAYTEIRVPKDCTVYCDTCNNLIDLSKGDPIPLCCGKIMEIVD